MSRGRPGEVTKLGSTVINMVFLVTSALAALGWLLAPVFVPVVAHGFPPQEQELVIRMVRWLMPGVVALSLSGVCAALLNAHNRFLASALIWVAANLVTIGFVIALHGRLGIFALVLGSVLGLFAQLVVQIPSIVRHRLYRFELDLRHPGLAKSWALLLPVAIGSGAGQINIGFDRYFASTLSAGSTAALNYTTKLTFLPNLIVASALATVIFPLIARHFASSDRLAIRHSISLALRMVTFIVIPSATVLSVLAYPIVQTLFQRGAFGPEATALCAGLVPFACLPLIALCFNTVLARACYACKEVRAAVIGSVIAVLVNIALSAFLSPRIGARGLLIANGISLFMLVAFEIALLWRLVGGFEWKPLVSSLVRIAIASLAMAASLFWIRWLVSFDAVTPLAGIVYLAGLLAFAALVFLGIARAIGVDEVNVAFDTLSEKFSRKRRRA
jgi:putative peptidoglycan lipid II flippase